LTKSEDGILAAAVELQEVEQAGFGVFVIEEVGHLEELRNGQVAGEVGVEEVRHGELGLKKTGQPERGQ
jgi:hypothetical protein